MQDEAAAMDWAKKLLLVLSNTMNKSLECHWDKVEVHGANQALDTGMFAFLRYCAT